MIRVGTDFQYQGQTLPPGEIVFVPDHHYDEDAGGYPLRQLLENSTDPKSMTVVFYTVLRHDDGVIDSCKSVYMPFFTAWMANQMNRENIDVSWDHRTYTFNFMINKPRRNREFLLQMISHFELKNFTHTLCWKNTNGNLATITNPQYLHLQKPVSIEPRKFLLGQEQLMDRGLRYGSVTNAQNYKAFLKSNLFESSCVSLITEPAFYERETIVTEKTLMAIWGGTLPIWVGGWGTADWMRSAGFDVFDDVIDHSYQWMSDPYDRCYHAIYDNLDILQDHARTQQLIIANQARFRHNLDLLQSNFLIDLVKEIIQENGLETKLHHEYDLLKKASDQTG
jgi:hypothetical protein